MRLPIKKISVIGILAALGIVLSVLETFIPMGNMPLGAKMGLANIATMLAFPVVGGVGALSVLSLRIVISALLTGRIGVILISFSGGIAAYTVMLILYKSKINVSFVGISVLGAIFHAVAQMTAVMAIIGNAGVLAYLPFLMLTSAVTGIFTGICSNLLVPEIKKYME